MTKYTPKTKDELKALISDESIELGDIDTSAITDMSELFKDSKRKDFNGIENWDVSNVTNMDGMFCLCTSFNQPLENWNVSNVTIMRFMFFMCENFNQPLEKWDVSKVTDMFSMFARCEKFNQPLGKWNVSNVADIGQMFYHCYCFNQSLDSWDVSKVEYMDEFVFVECKSLKNKPLWYNIN